MKSFKEFQFIIEGRMEEKLGNMSDSDFEDFLKGRTTGESESFRKKRANFKKTTVSGQNVRGNTKQTPPPPSSGKSGGTPPPPPPKSNQSTTSPSSSGNTTSTGGRTPRPYRNSGVGRSERVGNLNTPPKSSTPSATPKVGKWAKIGKFAGPASAALDTALSTADERAKGSGWARSLAKGATVAAGGILGGTAGVIGGGGVGSAALGVGGAMLGASAAEKGFDTVAGANARERKAMATANRQRQAGTSIKGIGGKTSFSQKKPGGPAFMSTGSGSQRRTVQLAKTGVVQRGGQSTAGHLAFKGGKAVYKAGPNAQSLAKTSSNPLERVGRTLFAGAYKKHDAAKSQQALQKARQSDMARQQKLGVKNLPGK